MKVSQNIEVINRLGLHARACASLVKTASEFDAQVEVRVGDHVCDGKSIMGLMMLAAGKGSKLKIRAEGPTETGEEMLDQMSALFDRRFEEA